MQSTTRVLVIMRHAKAEPSAPSDHERVLTDRGVSDADEAGAWLARPAPRPAAPWSRTRRAPADLGRARRRRGLGRGPGVRRALYAAGPDTALDLLRETDDAVGRWS